MYGVCLTIFEPFQIMVQDKEGTKGLEFFRPKCICILSAYPYLVAFREYLTQLERLTKSGEMTVPVERYIANFCSEVAAPPPGSFEVQVTIADSVIKFWSPPYNQPIAWVSLPFAHLFECLDIHNIITLWHALALERQVLVVSTQKTLLTTVCEILVSLLFPMRWSHAYIPLLPKFLVSILSAPMPFLCGVDKNYFNEALEHLNDECIVVDLDCNHVSFGHSPVLPPIPRDFEKRLHQKLVENAGMIFREARSLTKEHDYSDRGIYLPLHMKVMADAMWESKRCLYDEAFHLCFTPDQEGNNLLNGNEGSHQSNSQMQSKWDAVQEAFMSVYVGLLSSYRHSLVFPSKDNMADESESLGSNPYGGAGFRSKEFLKSQRHDRRIFLKELINTQMFDEFITKRLYGSGASDVTFFDLAIDCYLKKNRFSLDRSFHTELDPVLYGVNQSVRPNSAPNSMRKFWGKMRLDPRDITESKTLLCSSAVHRRLKTIVPPEPTSSSINPFENEMLCGNESNSLGSSSSKQTNDTAMLSPATSSESPTASTNSNNSRSGRENLTYTKRFKYPYFPSKLDIHSFGTPRPLPSAILAEFERQKENAAQFRKWGKAGKGSMVSF